MRPGTPVSRRKDRIPIIEEEPVRQRFPGDTPGTGKFIACRTLFEMDESYPSKASPAMIGFIQHFFKGE